MNLTLLALIAADFAMPSHKKKGGKKGKAQYRAHIATEPAELSVDSQDKVLTSLSMSQYILMQFRRTPMPIRAALLLPLPSNPQTRVLTILARLVVSSHV